MRALEHENRPSRLSFVVVTDSFDTIAPLVEHLVAQTIAAEIELVAACPSTIAAPERSVEPLAFKSVLHPLLPLGEARAAAVRASSAPVVAVGETHSFPAPDWAERMLRAHDGPWAAVVPAIENANPEGGVASWSSFLIDYGHFMVGGTGHEVSEPPPYNVVFKREVLLSFGRQLGDLLEPGSALGQELRGQGHHSYYEPRARLDHLNVATRRAWLHERFLGGRLLGARRRGRWPLARTMAYVAGSPLIPLVRLLRTRNALTAATHAGHLPPHTGLAVMLACVLWGFGELVGYVAGGGGAEGEMVEYELHKARYL